MLNKNLDFKKLTSRPEPNDRLFVSEAVERAIVDISARIGDPEIRKMFQQCLPNSLDTATYYRELDGQPDTYMATGDIPAMWLRDSTSQVWPYRRFIKEDEKLQRMFAGLIFRQTQCVLIDPYANAFRHPHMQRPPRSFMWGFGKGWDKGVWERKYELDSLDAYFRLSNGYYEATGDATPFNDSWVDAATTALSVIKTEQGEIANDAGGEMYRALRPNGSPMPKFPNNGEGPANKKVGLSRNLYRPSDDEIMLPYLIPANAMAVVALNGSAEILRTISKSELADEFTATASEIDQAIRTHGIVDDPKQGRLYAYEVDGFGGKGHYELMDDPNVPSLLSLPYLGYVDANDPVYQNTRRYILSDEHKYYARGKYEGLTSEHVKPGKNFWPIATIMRIMTSDDDAEIIAGLKTLKETHAGTHFMHESIDVNNPRRFTRPWFGWANSLFGEMIMDLMERKPELLAGEI